MGLHPDCRVELQLLVSAHLFSSFLREGESSFSPPEVRTQNERRRTKENEKCKENEEKKVSEEVVLSLFLLSNFLKQCSLSYIKKQ